MLVLSWNLFHGRAVPERPRALLGAFAATLAAWEWDVALLQEVPPWWPPQLALACAASARTALTSRNAGIDLRRAVAVRRPDLIKSNGGGANAILVRGETVAEHRVRRLRLWPERRVMHAVALQRGWWIANVHAQVHSEQRAQADIAATARTALGWAAGAPLVLGGDLNTRHVELEGFTHAAAAGVDHVLVHGLSAAGRRELLDGSGLSDHAPLRIRLGPADV